MLVLKPVFLMEKGFKFSVTNSNKDGDCNQLDLQVTSKNGPKFLIFQEIQKPASRNYAE